MNSSPGPFVAPSNLAENIYLRLKSELFDFILLPGDRFSEKEIAVRTGASRTPVREALFRLQREGYVEVLPRSGWQVRPLDFALFDELYQVRILLEEGALASLGQHPEQPIIQELMAIWCCPARARQSRASLVADLDESFHGGLIAATGNTELARMHQEITEKLRIIRRLDFTQPPRVEATYLEHAAILECVASGHVAAAQHLLRRHIQTSQREVHKITLSALQKARRGDPAAVLPEQRKRPEQAALHDRSIPNQGVHR